MCDCYTAKCKGCGALIPMHLADFNTPREDIDVYCEECRWEDTGETDAGQPWFRDRAKDGVVWEYKTTCVIIPKTETARDNIFGNHPNTGDSKMLERFGEPTRATEEDGAYEMIPPLDEEWYEEEDWSDYFGEDDIQPSQSHVEADPNER